LTDIAPPYQRCDLTLGFQPSWHLFHRRLLRFYDLTPTPFYLAPPLPSETALSILLLPPFAFAPASLPLAPLPNLCLPTSSIPPASYHFTHRYAHALRPPPLSPALTAPLAITSTAPAISSLPPACKAGKTLLLDASKLSAMAVLYLLSFGWDKNTSHRKWYYLSGS